jgi:hypothetical protein
MASQRNQREQSDWHPFTNPTADKIPAFACVEISESKRVGTGANRKLNSYEVKKPTAEGKIFAFNGPVEVSANGGRGRLTKSTAFVLHDPAEDPKTGDEYGPVPGQWYVGKDKTGARILGQKKDGRVRATLLGSGGGSATVNFIFCKVTEEIDRATGWAIDDAGLGKAYRIDDEGVEVGDELDIINRYFDIVPVNSAIWVLELNGDYFLVNSGCSVG